MLQRMLSRFRRSPKTATKRPKVNFNRLRLSLEHLEDRTVPDCSGFLTVTQGGWGAVANSNNPGAYRDANFASVFPNGLQIGDQTPGSATSNSALAGTYAALFDSSAAIQNYLPDGGPAAALTHDYSDPTHLNVLAGQTTALALNVGFDAADPNFDLNPNNPALGTLIVQSGPFEGKTVQQVLDAANLFLSGAPSPYTASQLNTAATAINENFDGVGVDNGFLDCQQSQFGSISGTKWQDSDGLAATHDYTGGLGGFTIYVDVNGINGNDQPQYSAVTADDGTYSISNIPVGTYNVYEVSQAGYTTVIGSETNVGVTAGVNTPSVDFANFQNVDVCGTKFEDHNGNGAQDAGDQGLANFNFVLTTGPDLVTNGSFESPNIGGGFHFYSSIPGWTATSNAIEIQHNVAGTAFDGNQLVELDSYANSSMVQTIATTPGQTYALSFAYSPRPGVASSSNGIDVSWNGSPVTSLATSGIGNSNTVWTVYTFAVTATGSSTPLAFAATGTSDSLGGYLDAVSVKVAAATATSDNTGDYCFHNIGPGTYQVLEVSQAPVWIQTTANPPAVTTSSGVEANGGVFGNFKTVNISGHKFTDVNGDDTTAINGDDTALSGWPIQLYTYNGTTYTTVGSPQLTQPDGSYTFSNLGPLAAGTSYVVKEVTNTAWTQTFGSGGYTVAATSGNTGGGDFANFQNIIISGFKFYDANTNGTFDGVANGEGKIAGWTITLYNDVNGDGNLQLGVGGDTVAQTTTTNSAGNYSFTVTHAGQFLIMESTTAPAGFTQTGWVPTTDIIQGTAVLHSGDTGSAVFGNVEMGRGGGLTLGFWSNKNGLAAMTKDVGGMTGALSFLSGLNLRNADGSNFDPTSYTQFRNWLLSANATNMAYMLSAQLAAMELNVREGFVNGGAYIYAPGTNSADQNGFALVSAVMAEANTALGANGNTTAAGVDRTHQETLKTALDNANNNLTFVLTWHDDNNDGIVEAGEIR